MNAKGTYDLDCSLAATQHEALAGATLLLSSDPRQAWCTPTEDTFLRGGERKQSTCIWSFVAGNAFLWCKGGVGVYGLPRQTFSFGSLGVRAGRSRGASWLHVAPRKCMPPTGYGYGLPVGQTNTVDRVSCGRRHVCSVFVWGLCYARTWGPTVLSRRSASSVLRGDGKT